MSPCAITNLLVPKKDKSWCICMDNKWINQITMKYQFPMMTFQILLDQLNGVRVFLKIDMHSGYR